MNKKSKILIVDDLRENRELLSFMLKPLSCEILEAENGKIALEILEKEQVVLILLDIVMPVLDGIGFLRKYAQMNLSAQVLVCSGSRDITQAVEAMKLGAADYIEKPFKSEVLLQRAKHLIKETELTLQNEELKKAVSAASGEIALVGATPEMQKIAMMTRKLARSDSLVLIEGESGTGKELVARALHSMGPRKTKPFAVVDCGSISPNLVESELFGHEKGAFTGANHKREGLFSEAGDGTILLDEIGELPLEMQAKLLRVLQERQFRSVGSSEYRKVRARIIAATNRNLEEEVQKKTFRQDLFYRLNIVRIALPPLRERKEDIPLLVESFLSDLSDGAENFSVSMQTMKSLEEYHWPGNVRELRNSLERAMALADSEELLLDDILPADYDQKPVKKNLDESFPLNQGKVYKLQEYEKMAIEKALRFSGGNRREAAQMIGIGEATLYRKIREYDIDLPSSREL